MNTSVLAGLESEGWKRTTGRDTVWAVVFGCPQGIPVSYRHSDLELWEDHGKLFYRRKRGGGYEYMYVTEPYPTRMCEESWRALNLFCLHWGLTSKQGGPSIHGANCLHIRIRRVCDELAGGKGATHSA
jgi:hypothetical protein